MAPKNNGTVKLKAAAKNNATVATVRMGTSEEACLSNRVMEGSGGGLEFWMASDLWLDDLPLLRLRSARDWPEVDMLPPRRCENLPTALEGRPGIELVVVVKSQQQAFKFGRFPHSRNSRLSTVAY